MPTQKGKKAYHSASHKSNNDQLPNSLSYTQPSKHEQTSDEAAVVFTDSNALLYIVLRSMSPKVILLKTGDQKVSSQQAVRATDLDLFLQVFLGSPLLGNQFDLLQTCIVRRLDARRCS